jgi:hypothetical protein
MRGGRNVRIKTFVSLILSLLLLASSFTVASGVVAVTATSTRKLGAEGIQPSMLDSTASDPPIPVGIRLDFTLTGSVQYVSSSDYFYAEAGWVTLANCSSLTTDVQSAFLDPQQNNFTLQTSAPNFHNPPMTHFAFYDNETDKMHSWFFFQFHPGDLARGTYSFTGTWSATALAHPPDYTAQYSHSTVTLVIVTPVPVGENVTVDPATDLNLTFSNVTREGYAWTNKTSTVQAPLLANLMGQYNDIKVTASYSGNVTVSLAYDDTNMTSEQESSLHIMLYTPIPGDIRPALGRLDMVDISYVARRFLINAPDPLWDPSADINNDGKIDMKDIATCAKNFAKTSEWTNITSYIDVTKNIICGDTTHFSIIGIN